MKKFFLILLCNAIIVISCSDKSIKKSHVCANTILLSENVVFEFNNQKESNKYDVYLYINHIKQKTHRQVVFSIALTSENKDSINTVIGIPLIDKDGNFIGTQTNDYWVQEKKLLSQVHLPKGVNKIYCKHAMPIDTIDFIKEFGIRVVPVN